MYNEGNPYETVYLEFWVHNLLIYETGGVIKIVFTKYLHNERSRHLKTQEIWFTAVYVFCNKLPVKNVWML